MSGGNNGRSGECLATEGGTAWQPRWARRDEVRTKAGDETVERAEYLR